MSFGQFVVFPMHPGFASFALLGVVVIMSQFVGFANLPIRAGNTRISKIGGMARLMH
ncbi:MAG: hypothetical protein ABL984_06625 [Pyrinomonadaceae bacterium]